jgi:hypothetical protein
MMPCPSRGAVWQDGRTPLYAAAAGGHEAAVRELLKAGANADSRLRVVHWDHTEVGTTAMHAVCLWAAQGAAAPAGPYGPSGARVGSGGAGAGAGAGAGGAGTALSVAVVPSASTSGIAAVPVGPRDATCAAVVQALLEEEADQNVALSVPQFLPRAGVQVSNSKPHALVTSSQRTGPRVPWCYWGWCAWGCSWRESHPRPQPHIPHCAPTTTPAPPPPHTRLPHPSSHRTYPPHHTPSPTPVHRQMNATPLSIAVRGGLSLTVAALLAGGASPSVNASLLATALWHGHTSIARQLLDVGASVQAALQDSVRNGWAAAVAQLVDVFGADPLAGPPTPLLLACRCDLPVGGCGCACEAAFPCACEDAFPCACCCSC